MSNFRKMIVVESDGDGDCESNCCGGYSEPRVITIESLTAMLKKFGSQISWDREAMQELVNNEQFVKALDGLGFRNTEKIEKIEEKVRAEKRFFIHDPFGFGRLREIDLEKLSRLDAESLADEKVTLFQSIAKSSLSKVSPSAYRQMLEAKKKQEKAAEARRAKAGERAQKKRDREIAAARKLLEEAEQIT